MPVRSLRAEHAQATRTALMKAARKLFSKRAFADVSAEEIVQQARVTRGALYHHFKDKRDLFCAVADEVAAELTERIDAAVTPLADKPWDAITAGVDAFLDACAKGEFHRIVILEAPVVEGWEEWREHALRHEMGLMKTGLQLAMEAGVMTRQPVDVLAPVLLGVLNEGAMLIARAEDRAAAREEVGKTIHRLFEGLRT